MGGLMWPWGIFGGNHKVATSVGMRGLLHDSWGITGAALWGVGGAAHRSMVSRLVISA